MPTLAKQLEYNHELGQESSQLLNISGFCLEAVISKEPAQTRHIFLRFCLVDISISFTILLQLFMVRTEPELNSVTYHQSLLWHGSQMDLRLQPIWSVCLSYSCTVLSLVHTPAVGSSTLTRIKCTEPAGRGPYMALLQQELTQEPVKAANFYPLGPCPLGSTLIPQLLYSLSYGFHSAAHTFRELCIAHSNWCISVFVACSKCLVNCHWAHKWKFRMREGRSKAMLINI